MSSHAARLLALVVLTLLTPLPGARGQGPVVSSLYSFGGNGTIYPYSKGPLTQGSDGKFYGTTYDTASNSIPGTVYSFTPGTFTTIHDFSFANTDGANPTGPLVQNNDGKFYGTTIYGSGNGYGTVYSLTTTGTFNLLRTFNNTADGIYANGGLALAGGVFYGTTSKGGANNGGALFSITTAGTVTVLHDFPNQSAAFYYSPLVQGSDGRLYGTTNRGGANDKGTAYAITTAGVFTSLHDFTGTDGQNPVTALLPASGGVFYGTTFTSGSGGSGTVFSMTSAGVVTTLHSFTGTATDGAKPYGALIRGGDGDLYGTTGEGGANGTGTVYKITTAGVSRCSIASRRSTAARTTPTARTLTPAWSSATTARSTASRTAAGPAATARSTGSPSPRRVS